MPTRHLQPQQPRGLGGSVADRGRFPPVNGTNWDGANRDFTAIMGHNFADGAGNFEGYLGYRRVPGHRDHRDHSACQLTDSASSGGLHLLRRLEHYRPGRVREPPRLSGNLRSIGRPRFGEAIRSFNYGASHYLQRNDERYTAGFFGKLKFNDHAEAYTEFSSWTTRHRQLCAGRFVPGKRQGHRRGHGSSDGALRTTAVRLEPATATRA